LTLIFSISIVFFNLFCGNMQHQAEAALLVNSANLADVSALAAGCVSTYLRLAPLSGLLNPLLGYCIDHHGFGPMLAAVLFSGMAHAFALQSGAFYIGALLFSLFQASVFSYMYSYLAFEFGFEYYGLLAGITSSVASLATLSLQPLLSGIGAAHGWRRVQQIQLCSFGLLTFGLLLSKLSLRWLWHRTARPFDTLMSGNASIVSANPDASEELGLQRSFSMGDLHTSPSLSPCRRRPQLFPNVDDILLIDGAFAHHSYASYQGNSQHMDIEGFNGPDQLDV